MAPAFTCAREDCPHDAACTTIAQAAEVAEDAAIRAATASQARDAPATLRAASAAVNAAKAARKALPTMKDCTAYTFARGAAHHAIAMAADARILARHIQRPHDLRLATLAFAAGADIGGRQRAAHLSLSQNATQEAIADAYNEYVADALVTTGRAMQAHARAENNARAAGASPAAAAAAGEQAGSEVIEQATAARQAADEKMRETKGATAQ